MSYVSLMVHVDADRELGGRIGIAADLADRFHARLIGVAGWAPMSVFLAQEALINPAPAVPDLQDMKSLLDLKGQQFCKAVAAGIHQSATTAPTRRSPSASAAVIDTAI